MCIVYSRFINDVVQYYSSCSGYIMATIMCHRQAATENQWVILEPYIGAMQNAFVKFTHGAGAGYVPSELKLITYLLL